MFNAIHIQLYTGVIIGCKARGVRNRLSECPFLMHIDIFIGNEIQERIIYNIEPYILGAGNFRAGLSQHISAGSRLLPHSENPFPLCLPSEGLKSEWASRFMQLICASRQQARLV